MNLRGSNFVKALMIALTLSATGIVAAQQAADFRIETDLMEAGKAKPLDQSVTLFSGGVVYDYSRETPNKIMIVDFAQGRITLLDSQRQIQTRINLSQLQSGIESAKNKMLQVPGGPEKMEDAAKVNFDPSSNTISVGQKFIRYDAKLDVSPNAEFAQQYANFANVTSLLNAWQSAGNAPPPFARLQLNQALSDRMAMPTTITRTVFAGSREVVMISRIHPTYSLTSDEKQKVEQFNAMILTYPTKSLAEYNNPASTVKR